MSGSGIGVGRGIGLLAQYFSGLGIFGDMYGQAFYHDDVTPETVALTVADTWYPQIELVEGNMNVSGITFTSDDINGDYLQVVTGGDYLVLVSTCFGGTLNTLIRIAPLINGTPTDCCRIHRKLGTGGDVGSAAIGGVLDLSSNDKVTLAYSSPTAVVSVTVDSAQLILVGPIS